MANYDNVRGVGYSRYEGDNDEPEVDQQDAKIEELFFESYSGDLKIALTTDDGYVSISVPVKSRKDWNEFADSLPRWD